MKKCKRLIALAVALLATLNMVACGSNSESGNGGGGGGNKDTKPQETINESTYDGATQHFQAGTLHQVSVQETNKPFIVNKQSNYKVVVPTGTDDSSKLYEAASYLVKWLDDATGCRLPIIEAEGLTWSENATWLVFGCSEMSKEAGVVPTTENLGLTGYQIETVGNTVFLDVQYDDGFQRGILSLLDHLVGFEMYSEYTVVYEKDGTTLPNMKIVEKPDFELYACWEKQSETERYGMGFSEGDIYIAVEGRLFHNSFNYLPKATYQKDHGDWYAIDGKQLCYTARGNAEQYDLMVKTMAERVLFYADQNTRLSNITITQEDNGYWCTCDKCKEVAQQYNNAVSASVVMFINEVDDLVQAELQKRATEANTEKRVLNIVFFAYRKTEKPPVKMVNGEYVVDEKVRCNPTVGVYIAPIDSKFSESFYHYDNTLSAENIKGWAACSEKLFFWLYECNFWNYFFPLNSYDTMVETYRFLYENNAYYNRTQTDFENEQISHFSTLKAYINSKAMFNVNINLDEVIDDFFKNYFGVAEAPMRQFFDELQAYLRYLEQTNPSLFNGGIYDAVETTTLWPKKTLDGWMKLIDEAYALIEPLKTENPSQYTIMYNKINLESMFPRWALLQLYSTTFTDVEFKREALKFKEDCSLHGIKTHKEGDSIEAIFAKWGV